MKPFKLANAVYLPKSNQPLLTSLNLLTGFTIIVHLKQSPFLASVPPIPTLPPPLDLPPLLLPPGLIPMLTCYRLKELSAVVPSISLFSYSSLPDETMLSAQP